jgi:hypothetical protein
MAQTSCVILAPDDCERLTSIIADRNRPQKHVQRARIILHSDERLPVQEVARRARVSRPAVWRWQQRFAEEGVEGLLHDKTRPPGKAPLPPETVAQVLALTCSEPPGEVDRPPLKWPTLKYGLRTHGGWTHVEEETQA